MNCWLAKLARTLSNAFSDMPNLSVVQLFYSGGHEKANASGNMTRLCRLVVQQAHAVNAGYMDGVDNIRYRLELDVIVGFDESHLLDTDAEDFNQAHPKIAPGNYFVVDLHLRMIRGLPVAHLNHDRAQGRRNRVILRIGLLGNLRPQARRLLLDHHQHENHEQNEQNVNQR